MLIVSLARTKGITTDRLSECDCLPSCSELQYEIAVTKARRNWSQDLTHLNK